MRAYLVEIEVSRLYRVPVEASSREEAFEKANSLPTKAVCEYGDLIDVETKVLEVVDD